MALTVLLIEFPTGAPLTPRWRMAERIVLGGWLVTISAFALFAALNWSHPFEGRQSPSAVATVAFLFVFLVPVVGSFATSIAAMITRFRRATGDERLQLKWFVVGAAMILAGILIGIWWNNPATITLQVAAAIFWFATIAIAILKYRLYEIDIVINRAVVYGTLAVFITLVYVGLVIGVGTLVGNNRSPLLPQPSSRLRSSRCVSGQADWPTGWSTGRAPRRTRSCRTSRNASPARTPPRT
jgi:hypothetical protein